MIECQGDMLAEYLSPEVIYVITTNGYVKNNGQAVMGRGTAKAAADLHKDLPAYLGDLILAYGNRPFLLPYNFITLPVKYNWDEPADLELIGQSLDRLWFLLRTYDWFGNKQVYLPRPGCGNGQLDWAQVKPVVENWNWGDNVTVWNL